MKMRVNSSLRLNSDPVLGSQSKEPPEGTSISTISNFHVIYPVCFIILHVWMSSKQNNFTYINVIDFFFSKTYRTAECNNPDSIPCFEVANVFGLSTSRASNNCKAYRCCNYLVTGHQLCSYSVTVFLNAFLGILRLMAECIHFTNYTIVFYEKNPSQKNLKCVTKNNNKATVSLWHSQLVLFTFKRLRLFAFMRLILLRLI